MPSNDKTLSESERQETDSVKEKSEIEKTGNNNQETNRIDRIPPEKRIQPGQTRNPHGRPKGKRTFAHVIEELISLPMPEKFQEEFRKAGIQIDGRLTYEHGLIAAQIVKGVKNKDTYATKLLIETKDGRPITPIDANIDSNINIMFPQYLTDV